MPSRRRSPASSSAPPSRSKDSDSTRSPGTEKKSTAPAQAGTSPAAARPSTRSNATTGRVAGGGGGMGGPGGQSVWMRMLNWTLICGLVFFTQWLFTRGSNPTSNSNSNSNSNSATTASSSMAAEDPHAHAHVETQIQTLVHTQTQTQTQTHTETSVPAPSTSDFASVKSKSKLKFKSSSLKTKSKSKSDSKAKAKEISITSLVESVIGSFAPKDPSRRPKGDVGVFAFLPSIIKDPLSDLLDTFSPTAQALEVYLKSRKYQSEPWPWPTKIDLLTAGVTELREALQRKEITSVALVREYLFRIAQNNDAGLDLRAFLETAPIDSVLSIAADLDAKRAQGVILGPLHGIPIAVKDNIATDPALGMETTAGSYALLGSVVPGDATLVDKLRQAGAIILGKTNLSEWSRFKADNQTNGWSARGGRTKSAYVLGPLNRHADIPNDTCGSSSGSCVAVSAGWAAASVSTETEGSIICPANRAALYGIKPSVGLISRSGIIPISSTQDTAGPTAKSVMDCAIMLDVMAGQDPKDEKTKHAKISNYTSHALNKSFKGFKLGVPRKGFFDEQRSKNPPAVNQAIDAALQKMATLGAKISDPADFLNIEELEANTERKPVVLYTEMRVDLEHYLKDLVESPVRTLQDVVDFNDEHPDLEFPEGECCQERLVDSLATYPDYEEVKARNARIGGKDGIDAVLDRYGLDALVVPSEAYINDHANGLTCHPSAIAGYPLVTVPLTTLSTGQPTGLTFIGRKWSEGKLIELMAAWEANFEPRPVPKHVRLKQSSEDANIKLAAVRKVFGL